MAAVETTALQARYEAGGTPALSEWGIDNEYGVLRDVLLGAADSFHWMGEENAQFSALVRESIRKGRVFDPAAAKTQYAEMLDVGNVYIIKL